MIHHIYKRKTQSGPVWSLTSGEHVVSYVELANPV
jgi:hypothetical protein